MYFQHEAINGKGDAATKAAIAKVLVESGCSVNLAGMDDETALHEAARGRLDTIVNFLLQHGASPNIRNRSGQLPGYFKFFY